MLPENTPPAKPGPDLPDPINSADVDASSVAAALADAHLAGGLSDARYRSADQALRRLVSRLAYQSIRPPKPRGPVMSAREPICDSPDSEHNCEALFEWRYTHSQYRAAHFIGGGWTRGWEGRFEGRGRWFTCWCRPVCGGQS